MPNKKWEHNLSFFISLYYYYAFHLRISLTWLPHSIFYSRAFYLLIMGNIVYFLFIFFLLKVLYLVLSSFKPHTEFSSFSYLVIVLLKFNSGIRKKNKVKNTKSNTIADKQFVWLDKILYPYNSNSANTTFWLGRKSLVAFCGVLSRQLSPTMLESILEYKWYR